MVLLAISAPYIIYTSFLLGQSWHVCPMIDGRFFFFFWNSSLQGSQSGAQSYSFYLFIYYFLMEEV